MNDIRNVMMQQNERQMNQYEIIKQLQKQNPTRYNNHGFSKENVLDALNHYKKLQVVYIDTENNVLFL